MRESHARALVEASEGTEDELTLYEGYSGRWMFGEETFGVTGSSSAFARATGMAAREFSDDLEATDFLEGVGNIRTDSLGLDTIFY